MNSPYTLYPLDALMAAQASVGITMTAVLWARPLRPRVATAVMLAAIWLAVVSPVELDYVHGLGIVTAADHAERLLRLVAVLAALATVLTGRIRLAFAGVACAVALSYLRSYIAASDQEIAGAELAAMGLLLGLHYRTLEPRVEVFRPPSPLRYFLRDDAILFVIASGLSALVAVLVLGRHTNSGDEWADTYQAAVFAKLHAYDAVPPCSEAFRSFWVFQHLGRSFAQYTPGWPLFMAPFVWVRSVWLAGPCALGLLAVGVAHLSRRAASGFTKGTAAPSSGEARAAGLLGGLAVTLGSTMLLNGASRYPHVFVAAMFAWSVEALLRVADRALDHESQWAWGGVLGTASALLLSARPGDGAMLGVGLFAYFVYAAVRGRFGLRAILGGAIAFAAWGGLSLVILRLQVGEWFKTGYSLNEIFYPWNKLAWSFPAPDEIRWSIPLATGSYSWWPCSPALGLAGLFALRGRAQRVTFIMVLSSMGLLAFYTMSEIGRGVERGYGPRYELPCVVPMAVGTAAILAKLWTKGHARLLAARSAFHEGGPIAVALAAAILGIVRIAPLVYPWNWSDVRNHNRLNDAIAEADVHNAVVLAHEGIANVDAKDLTENLPLDLYPDQDVLIANDSSPDLERCVREHFPDRQLFHATSVGMGVKIRAD